MDWTGEQLHVKKLEDWYTVDANAVRALGGNGMLNQYESSLVRCLIDAYPEHQWTDGEVFPARSNRRKPVRSLPLNK
jgi:hypothetical protein